MTTAYKSLEDFLTIRSINDDGIVIEDNAIGFALTCDGVEASLFEVQEWNNLHERWRAFLTLQKDEELQVIFRKTSDFDKIIERKILEIEESSGSFGKRIFWSQISNLFDQINSDQIYETSLIICYRKYNVSSSERLARSENEAISAKRDYLLQQMEAMGLNPKLLNSAEIWQSIFRAANGRNYVDDIDLSPEWPKINISPTEVSINEDVFRSLTLKSLPESFSELGMIRAITNLQFPLEISVRYRGRDIEPLKKRFERKRQILFGLATRKATGDPASEAKFKETDSLLRRLHEQNDSLCEMTFTVGLRAKNPIILRRMLTALTNTQGSLHQAELEETRLSTFDSFLETIPFFKGRVFNQHSILSSNGIHFLPLFCSPIGDQKPVILFRTKQASLYTIDPTSNRLANYNWLVSGTSGAGKSFFVNSILLQSAIFNPRIFVVDIGGSYNKLTQFLGGKLISLDLKSSSQIGPFFMTKKADEIQERQRRQHIELVFQEMCRDDGRLPSLEERALLSDSLKTLFELEQLPARPICHLKDMLAQSEDPAGRRLSLLLRRYAYGSAYGDFLDHPHPIELNDSVITFDLKGLKEFEDLSRVVELILCSAIWQSLKSRDRFTYIVLDEVAFSLLKTQPQFVDELVSTVRKHFAGVIVCVQGLEKITSSSAGGAILANTNFKAILQQRGDARGYEEPLGLRTSEARAIRTLERQKGHFSDLFLMDDERRALLRYQPNSLEYLLSTSDPRENQILEERLSHFEGSYADKLFKLLEEEKL